MKQEMTHKSIASRVLLLLLVLPIGFGYVACKNDKNKKLTIDKSANSKPKKKEETSGKKNPDPQPEPKKDDKPKPESEKRIFLYGDKLTNVGEGPGLIRIITNGGGIKSDDRIEHRDLKAFPIGSSSVSKKQVAISSSCGQDQALIISLLVGIRKKNDTSDTHDGKVGGTDLVQSPEETKAITATDIIKTNSIEASIVIICRDPRIKNDQIKIDGLNSEETEYFVLDPASSNQRITASDALILIQTKFGSADEGQKVTALKELMIHTKDLRLSQQGQEVSVGTESAPDQTKLHLAVEGEVTLLDNNANLTFNVTIPKE